MVTVQKAGCTCVYHMQTVTAFQQVKSSNSAKEHYNNCNEHILISQGYPLSVVTYHFKVIQSAINPGFLLRGGNR